MAIVEVAKIQIRRGQENQTGVPRLDPGEMAWAQDTENLYIGKRVAEGAVDDSNTRILTENDIQNIFNLLNIASTTTLQTVYQYRAGVPYIESVSVLRQVQGKLDEYVSAAEFGLVASGTPTNVSTVLQLAIDTIFATGNWDSFERADSRRALKIPAGNYIVDQSIELPPYATIIGEGPELTKITLTSPTANIFRTIDAGGNNWDSPSMESGLMRARDVLIKDMTLEYSETALSDNALVSLDNVLNARVENCIIRTAFDSTSTATYGLVSSGVGVEIRGLGGGLGSGDVNLTENIHISECTFDGLYIGVRSTGTVIRPVIEDCVFSNLNRGINFYTINLLPGPSNSTIRDNRFENIVREAVYIGANPANAKGNHLIKNNFFIQVGNGVGLDDHITSGASATPILSLNSSANNAVDNFFYRQQLANTTASTAFYYAPLAVGRVMLDNSQVELVTITTATNSTTPSTTDVAKFCVNGQDQFFKVKYQLSNEKLSRKGELIVNLAPDGYSAITDTFNYIETVPEGSESPLIYFDVDSSNALTKNYVKLTCVNSSTVASTVMEYNVSIMI